MESRDGVVVRTLASHQCGPRSVLRSSVSCGLSLLVLFLAPRGFSLGTPVFPSPQKTNISPTRPPQAHSLLPCINRFFFTFTFNVRTAETNNREKLSVKTYVLYYHMHAFQLAYEVVLTNAVSVFINANLTNTP